MIMITESEVKIMYSDKDYRLDLIRGMNALIISMNNEEAYARWIYLVPDEATDEDLQEIAEDDELFDDAITLFCKLFNCYIKDGLFILNKLYK